VLGENVAGNAMCGRLADYGYAGGWPWQWNEGAGSLMTCLSGVVLE